ncbi:aromatic ring-hydroxylating dioxygenase subunit alpha [Stenotrophomonas sp.]|uniref:aromatic ring-hydroxylating dioxygenase subunit alpha n=1 Tax=Stenotrophomonas sp. TaxID=69392 RepID=UPI002FC815B1
MTPWHPLLSTHWYAVARADEVRTRPVAVTLLDTHIALARTAGGALIALEDRCPHRHAPLSSGCVVGERLACPYHGWSFDADGRLRDVPGLPADKAPPAISVRRFATCERDGFIWLRPAATGAEQPNAMIRATDPATRRFLWRTRWSANVVDAMENFLDPLHTHFIHAGLVRRDGKRVQATACFRPTDEGFTVDYRGMPAQSGLLYRLFESERTAERAHFAAPGSTRLEYTYANGSRVLIDLHFTPRSAVETDVFITLHVEGRWAPAWAVRLLAWPFLKRVNDQDMAMLALQAGNKRRFGERNGASTSLDIVRGTLEHFWTQGVMPSAPVARDVKMLL